MLPNNEVTSMFYNDVYIFRSENNFILALLLQLCFTHFATTIINIFRWDFGKWLRTLSWTSIDFTFFLK